MSDGLFATLTSGEILRRHALALGWQIRRRHIRNPLCQYRPTPVISGPASQISQYWMQASKAFCVLHFVRRNSSMRYLLGPLCGDLWQACQHAVFFSSRIPQILSNFRVRCNRLVCCLLHRYKLVSLPC